jgi:tetratricopeptide (TPR) repeat protein
MRIPPRAMPDPITDIADPEIQGELDGLRLLVEETTGNVIAFVRYERVTEREAGIRYLKEQLSIPVVERVLSEDRKNPLALLDNLSDQRCCVQFYDLEAALTEVTGYLNVNREAYAEVPHALVFWVGEHGLREVATNAPDFWAWRSGVFDVRSGQSDLLKAVSQIALTDGVRFTDQGDLQRRADLYQELISEKNDPEYIARLRLKLAAVLHMLGELDASEREACQLKVWAEERGHDSWIAAACHLLGTVFQEREEYEKAEEYYRKSVELRENLDSEYDVSATYHQLGTLAREREELEVAEKWYRKAVEAERRLGKKQSLAKTYYELGRLAQRRQKLEKAEDWYRKAMGIEENLGNERDAAMTYRGIGELARERRNFAEAEKWLQKSLEIESRLEDDRGAAATYHELGKLAHERGNLAEAKKMYLKSLEVRKKLGYNRGVASTYNELGRLSREQENFEEAKKYHRKSLENRTKIEGELGAAQTYHELGMIAQELGNRKEAEGWYHKSAKIKEQLGEN